MRIDILLSALLEKEVIRLSAGNLEIHGIAHDSRKVKSGDLFVAVQGQEADGHCFVAQAVANGAVAVLAQRDVPGCPETVPFIVVPDSRAALATAAAAFYGFPAHRLKVIGVTGTDGKTTTTMLIQSILTSAGHKTGMISTVGATVGDAFFDTGTHVTTPDALDMQRYLALMVEEEMEYAVLETTSHGLDQMRVKHCAYDVAVVTNITNEHLNYHGSYEAYREAKSRLFRSLLEDYRKPNVPKVSVLNVDDPSFEYLRCLSADVTLTYGLVHPADFSAESIHHTRESTAFTARTPLGYLNVEMALLGEIMVYNALAAIAACYSQGVPMQALAHGIASVDRVPARFERVDCGQDFDVFVDFAHTPNALERVLQHARELTRKHVVLVFGLSGGLRDRSKRPIMGEIAGKLADKVVITSVDWYAEDVSDIMHQIAAGCERAGHQKGEDYWCIRDRREGIAFGLDLAQPGDVVIVAGKGHERSICYGNVEQPWDEFGAVREGLQIKLNSTLKG